MGGKIVSLYYKPDEFETVAQIGKNQYNIPFFGADFSQYDASGIDDAFPTINESIISYNNRKIVYPDHGEIWSSRFDYQKSEGQICLYFKSSKNMYSYKKTVKLEEDGILLSYEITNESEEEFPCLWTFHGLFQYEEDMELIYPLGTEMFLNVLDSQELGKSGESIKRINNTYDFSKVPECGKKTMLKYYVNSKVQEGFCGYRYKKREIDCILEYDSEKLPYLGIWITAGGYRGDYNIAFEPSTGFYDSIDRAIKNKTAIWLKKGYPFTFNLKIKIVKSKEK